jgi:hypothetical protein
MITFFLTLPPSAGGMAADRLKKKFERERYRKTSPDGFVGGQEAEAEASKTVVGGEEGVFPWGKGVDRGGWVQGSDATVQLEEVCAWMIV